jgi:hypothetical protein
MKPAMIVAACAAVVIVALSMFAGQPAAGTWAKVQILSRTTSPFDVMKDARRLPAQTDDNAV